MSESVASPSLTAKAGSTQPKQYALSDDLARMCLPMEFRDSYRTLAWVNSICFVFLLIGLVGLKPPAIVVRQLPPVAESSIVPFTPPPEEQPKPEEIVQNDEPPPQDAPIEAPQVVTIVAAVDSPNVSFPVPVPGATAVAPAHLASPPPPSNYRPSAPVKFDPNAASEGSYPKGSYPGYALRNRMQGTVTLIVKVDSSGHVVDATIQKTSGFTLLDESAVKTIKERWRFPPREGIYEVPYVFKIE
jgi:protein TonB